MAKRGGVARAYDAVRGFFARKAASWTRAGRGERAMAGFVGPYGGGWGSPTFLSKAEQVQHFRGWNWKCIDHICSRVSKEPPTAVRAASPREVEKHRLRSKAFAAGRGPEPEARAFAPPWWKTKALGPQRGDEDYEFLTDDDPLVRLLNDPNDPETGVSLWYEAELFNCLTGEDFIWMVEGDGGRVAELWVLPSHWVWPVCLGEDKLVDHFEVRAPGSTSGLERFDPEQVIWNRRPSPVSKIYAAAPTQAAAALIDSYEKIEAARNFALDNGALVGGQINIAVETQVTDATIQRLESRLIAKHGGVFNAFKPLILQGATYTPPPADQELAFGTTQEQQRRNIMAMWGLDEVVLGFATAANRAAMVAAIANTNEVTIGPRKAARAAVLTEKLAKRFDPRARLFYRDDTPVDPDARRQDFVAGGPLNAVSANDYRVHVLNLEPWPEEIYDRPLVSAGLVNPGEDGGDQWDMGGGLPGGAGGGDGAGDGDPFGGLPDQADGLGDDADLSAAGAFKGFKPPRAYACAMVPLDGPAAEAVLDLGGTVREDDLGEDGREDDPHVTALFGLHTDDVEEVRRVVAGFGPVRLRLGGVSVFRGADSGKPYDVLKVDVDSPDLVRLHDVLATLPHTKTHPRFVPHATIAYVKAGLGDDYARRMGRLDLDVTADRLVFSGRDRRRASIGLTGTKALTSWLTTKDAPHPGPPPFEGAVFDRSRHRWVKPDGGEPDPEHHAAADAATARTLAGKIAAAGTKAVAVARRVGAKAKELAYRIANSGVGPDDILDNVYDYGRIYSAKGAGDWLSANLGVTGHVVPLVASHVLAYAVTKVRQHLRKSRTTGTGSKGWRSKAGETDRAALVAEVLGAILTGMGCPPDELPTAEDVRGHLDEKAVEGLVTKAGFTGRRTDTLGRARCYADGKPVACHALGGDHAAAGKRDAARQMLADPAKLHPHQLADLNEHLKGLTAEELKALQKEFLGRHGSRVKPARVAALAEWARSRAGGGAHGRYGDPAGAPKAARPDVTVEPAAGAREAAAALFGRPAPDALLAALACAPAGSTVEVAAYKGGVVLFASDPATGVSTVREVRRDEDGAVVCNNTSIDLGDRGGAGLGTELFAEQVRALRAAGVARIETSAAGGPGESKNGYHTWARLGYDGRVRGEVAARLPPALRAAAGPELSVRKLVDAPGGAAWWKAHGLGFAGTFDLADGSPSMRALDAYLRERAAADAN